MGPVLLLVENDDGEGVGGRKDGVLLLLLLLPGCWCCCMCCCMCCCCGYIWCGYWCCCMAPPQVAGPGGWLYCITPEVLNPGLHCAGVDPAWYPGPSGATDGADIWWVGVVAPRPVLLAAEDGWP